MQTFSTAWNCFWYSDVYQHEFIYGLTSFPSVCSACVIAVVFRIPIYAYEANQQENTSFDYLKP
jgi:hypothetical protein